MLFKTRYNILSTVLILYLLPLLGLNFYTINHALEIRWGVFCFSLFLLSMGSCILFLIVRHWENEFINRDLILDTVSKHNEDGEAVSSSVIQTSELDEQLQQMEARLVEAYTLKEQAETAIQEKQAVLVSLTTEKELLQDHVSTLLGELNLIKEATAEKLEQNQIFLNEHQQTITEQRHAIEVKQQHIQQLEDKVRDLTYEIKTLLHLAEKTQIRSQRELIGQQEAFLAPPASEAISPPNQRQPETDACQQLKHCIEIAQKMTGASHYQNRTAKKTELAIEHYALDLRCLFESLRSETTCAIMIYSPKEGKLIFGNNLIKPLLGWTAEKFILNFPTIIEESIDVWNSTLAQLAYKNECQTELLMRSKAGGQVKIKCYLGVIPTGIFRSNILGLLYPANN